MNSGPDLTSAALFNLVRYALAEMDLLPRSHGFIGPVRGEARVPHEDKATLLSHAMREGGAAAVLRIGRYVGQFRSALAVDALLRAQSPPEAVRRWRRLERFYHSRNRTRVIASTPGSLVVEHFATTGAAPGIAEDLLIAGVMSALIAAAGGERHSARFGDGVSFIANGSVSPDVEVGSGTAIWHFTWVDTARPAALAAPAPLSTSLGSHLEMLYSTDRASAWTVERFAQQCGMSARTLQRRLSSEQTSLRVLLRDFRAHASARLLTNSSHSLVEIAFACGYADQPHFNREFKRCIGIQPGRYREMLDQRN